MLKFVLKCIESIRIKKNGSTNFKILSANLVGGGGVRAKLVKNQLYFYFFKPSLSSCVLNSPGAETQVRWLAAL